MCPWDSRSFVVGKLAQEMWKKESKSKHLSSTGQGPLIAEGIIGVLSTEEQKINRLLVFQSLLACLNNRKCLPDCNYVNPSKIFV